MPLANGTWVEFTAMREMSDGGVRHLNKATGVIVDHFVEDGVGYYAVQHYEGSKPVPAPSRYAVRDDPLMIRELTNLPPLRVLPERAAAIEAEATMSAAAIAISHIHHLIEKLGQSNLVRIRRRHSNARHFYV